MRKPLEANCGIKLVSGASWPSSHVDWIAWVSDLSGIFKVFVRDINTCCRHWQFALVTLFFLCVLCGPTGAMNEPIKNCDAKTSKSCDLKKSLFLRSTLDMHLSSLAHWSWGHFLSILYLLFAFWRKNVAKRRCGKLPGSKHEEATWNNSGLMSQNWSWAVQLRRDLEENHAKSCSLSSWIQTSPWPTPANQASSRWDCRFVHCAKWPCVEEKAERTRHLLVECLVKWADTCVFCF